VAVRVGARAGPPARPRAHPDHNQTHYLIARNKGYDGGASA
jgi:hypothetical protein